MMALMRAGDRRALLARSSLSLGIAAVGVLMSLGVSVAVSGWSIQPTPNSTGAQGGPGGGLLMSVSCLSADNCTAVGFYDTRYNEQTLVERWNGATWSIQPSPNLRNNALESVSCSSSNSCTAVGDYFLGPGAINTDQRPFAEHWNGTRWMLQSTPSTHYYSNNLLGISCTSATSCTAVGYYQIRTGTDVGLVENWNGIRWDIQTIGEPALPQRFVLESVSCTSTRACVAVGYSYPPHAGPSGALIAELWNGKTWSFQRLPSPRGTLPSPGGAVLTGVSCVSSKACIAVGQYRIAGGRKFAFVERWDGTRWTLQPAPNLVNVKSSGLGRVSCTSSTACTAVGYYVPAGHKVLPLVGRWDGTSWQVQTFPTPVSLSLELAGVSCSSISDCTAVGAYFDESEQTNLTLAERWQG
jgi:uncharacterized membrane protein